MHLTQDGDSCGGDMVQELTLETADAGGGHFWIIKTERWAVEDLDEFAAHIKKLADMTHPMTLDTALDELTKGTQ